MGLALYTAGVILIVVGCFQMLNMIIKPHYLVCNITMIIACIVIGIIGIVDGIKYMKGGH